MTTACQHQAGLTWVSNASGWSEKDAQLSMKPGYWICNGCPKRFERHEQPLGSGMCRACNRPIDDHENVGTEQQRCRRP